MLDGGLINMEQQNIAKTIAGYMIAEGCEQTSSGNWIFTYDEINNRFGTDLPNDAELINQIAEYIYAEKSDVVSDLDLSQGFDLDFYIDHCPNIDESCLGEMGME